MESGDHCWDCPGVGELYVQKRFGEPSRVEVRNLEGIRCEGGGTDGDEEGEHILQRFYPNVSSLIYEPKSTHNSPSAPNGIWNISAIQGRSHALKLCEKACQLTSPNPVPHSAKHCSYDSLSGGGGSVELCVAFHSKPCCSRNLAPHALSLTASTRLVDATRRTTSNTAVGRKA